MGISGEKKARYAGDEHGAYLNVDSLDAGGYEMDKQGLQILRGFKTYLYWYISSEC